MLKLDNWIYFRAQNSRLIFADPLYSIIFFTISNCFCQTHWTSEKGMYKHSKKHQQSQTQLENLLWKLATMVACIDVASGYWTLKVLQFLSARENIMKLKQSVFKYRLFKEKYVKFLRAQLLVPVDVDCLFHNRDNEFSS